jgi:hypothetical protein
MDNQLVLLLMRHLSLLDRSEKLTYQMHKAAASGDIAKVHYESDNRERMINVIETFQTSIEDTISKAKSDKINPTFVEIMKCWSHDVNLWVERTTKIDNETTGLLEAQKEQATREIATVFKTNQQFKGYNLNNVK